MMKPRTAADPSASFKAFADPTRLRILNLLLVRELCVCDLCDVLEEIQPKVSRHLAYLRRAGLISSRESGRWSYYRVTPSPGALDKSLLRCVGSCLRGVDVLAQDLTRLDSLPRRGQRCA